MAAENLILTLLLSGEWDAARSELLTAATLPVGPQLAAEHRAVLDLLQTALYLRLGQAQAAGERLALIPAESLGPQRRWVLDLLLAEQVRQGGAELEAPALEPNCQWQWPWLRLFPELYLHGSKSEGVWQPLGPPTAQLNLAGPVQLSVGDYALPLGRKSRGLLAYLLLEGGSASAESVAEALGLAEGAARTVQKRLSKVVTELRYQLGSPGAVHSAGGIVSLGEDLDWQPPILPPAARADRFCQGDFFPFVNRWIELRELRFPECWN